jgi:predicted P-type ATPase
MGKNTFTVAGDGVLRALLFLSLISSIFAAFGDYSSDSFECPAFTTCPTMCAKGAGRCQTRCEGGLLTCSDGSCQNPCPAGLTNPCPKCAPFACPKVNDAYETCLTKYESLYEFESQCREEELNAMGKFNAKPLSILGLWLILVTVATFFWTGCVNRPGPPESDKTSKFLDEATKMTVTGYQKNIFGTLLFLSVVLTLVGFHLVILAFAISSYYENQEESLRVFEVVWSIGFAWTLLFKWPYSIGSIFYKRCRMHVADTVCIFSPSTTPESLRSIKQLTQTEKENSSHKSVQRDPVYIAVLRHSAHVIAGVVNNIMAGLFSMPARGNGKMQYVPVKTDRITGTRYFVFQFRRYNYDSELETFQAGCLKIVDTIGDVLNGNEGLSTSEVERRLRIVGPNTIEMQKPNALECVISEFSKPFYCYQFFMLWTWVPLYYFYMAIIHGSCVIVGGFTAAFFRYRNESNLYKLSHISGEISCRRDGQFSTIQQSELVPGDIVNVIPGMAYSDMVMVSTEGLLVDESALTGESTPMAKTAVDPSDRGRQYSTTLFKKHTISAGTTVIEAEMEDNTAIVFSTGSYTSKGELLREIFQYERASFAFDAEVPFVMAFLLTEAIIGFALVVHLISEQPVYAWFYGMYVVSCLLPPLLPTVFTVSVGVSDNRLTKNRIACSNSEDILVAGKVTRAFFDKTGTLTRQGLDFISAKSRDTWESEGTELSPDLVTGMSCCHHLTQSMKGDIIGNPVDRTMFAASGAQMVSSAGTVDRIVDINGSFVDVLKHFDFDHHRMSQSVIAKRADGSLVCFVKGSGESIQKLCLADTLPSDFSSVVRESAKAGTYQISMAMKRLADDIDVSILSRDELESDLTFIGVINFKNVLRDETPEVIRHLESGEVSCIMVTGDSVLTGIRIAKECGMVKEDVRVLVCSQVNGDGSLTWIDGQSEEEADLPANDQMGLGTSNIELAVTGEVWGHLIHNEPNEAAALARSIRVYGRCTPFTKVSVVSTFVEMGFITLMCGDGGNDCGALKTAHVGVALSDAEASVVSSFTSLDKTITSVVEILREGRCALASALASYKYIIMYGQIEGMNNVILAYFRINFAEYNWTFMDGFWVIGMSFTLPLAKAAKFLSSSRPTSSLLGVHTTTSLVGVLFINMSFTCLSLFILFQQEWFQCRKYQNDDVSNLLSIGDNYETTTLFIVAGYQYISSAMAYNFGYEFRQGWLRNTWFVALVVIYSSIHYYITLVPGKLSCFFRVNCANEDVLYSISAAEYVPIQNAFNTTIMPMNYRIILVVLMTLNAILNMMWDYFVVNGTRKKLLARRHRQQYKSIAGDSTSKLELA